jgi:hypothetical protein
LYHEHDIFPVTYRGIGGQINQEYAFNEAWRAGAARMRELMPPPKPIPPKERAKDILEVFVDILDMATPAEWMVE